MLRICAMVGSMAKCKKCPHSTPHEPHKTAYYCEYISSKVRCIAVRGNFKQYLELRQKWEDQWKSFSKMLSGGLNQPYRCYACLIAKLPTGEVICECCPIDYSYLKIYSHTKNYNCSHPYSRYKDWAHASYGEKSEYAKVIYKDTVWMPYQTWAKVVREFIGRKYSGTLERIN